MRVVARVSDYLHTQLLIALGREHDVTLARSWSELAETLRRHPADVVILEPTPVDAEELDVLLRLLADFRATPAVVYTSITPEAMRVTVELGRQGVHHVVFRGIDDAPARLRALLEDLTDRTPISAVWPWVSEQLLDVPPALHRAIDQLFRAPERFRDVSELTAAAGLARRTVERWVTRAGLSSARSLVVAARVERAAHLIRHSSVDAAAVARQLGYPSARLMARQIRIVTNHAPLALRRLTDAAALRTLLVEFLTAPPAGVIGRVPSAIADPHSDGDAA
jgi:AraC-like DNA-binding protein